ncbi:Hypothetical predicted protein [Mytilus galloprovincialis]|uniref:Uncharacterized protein n=1 Tax=Mytilus galloprovincialis TaxID=29158 RepID=A0A8B6BQS2_MYTGA|nr:Hypothetical predicted protein [Mytilus galloprovincialis]
MGVISSTTNGIDEESTKVKAVVYAARQGNWDSVFSILKTYPHLVNAIPEDRRWGVLHQAVWWNKQDILKKLLCMPACDSRVQTKETTSEIGETSACTPQEVAQKYKYTDMEKLLEQHSIKLTTEEELEDLPTFHYQNSDVQLKGLGLLRITLASYRQTLCPFTINKHKSLAGVMEDIFRHIDTEENWTTVKTKICDSLYTVCKPAVTVLKATKTKQEFYSKIVNVYTNEGTQLYMYLNTALRRQEEKAYTPTAKDLGLGPYILMFHLLLMHWKKLVPERGITYRRMLVKDSDCRRYQKGTQFIWMSFVSSSVDLAKAEPFPTCAATGEHKMTFIIDNRNPSRWRPRNIENHAQYVERERVYPAGGEFLVTDRTENDGTTEIRLKLLDRGLASS